MLEDVVYCDVRFGGGRSELEESGEDAAVAAVGVGGAGEGGVGFEDGDAEGALG